MVFNTHGLLEHIVVSILKCKIKLWLQSWRLSMPLAAPYYPRVNVLRLSIANRNRNWFVNWSVVQFMGNLHNVRFLSASFRGPFSSLYSFYSKLRCHVIVTYTRPQCYCSQLYQWSLFSLFAQIKRWSQWIGEPHTYIYGIKYSVEAAPVSLFPGV